MIITLTVIIKTTNTQLVLHNFILVITLTITVIITNTTFYNAVSTTIVKDRLRKHAGGIFVNILI